MSTDQTFITNKKGEKLLDRFKDLIKDTEFFDVIVGFFYVSGFHALYKSLERTKKIRILIGIGIGKKSYQLIEESRKLNAQGFDFSNAKVKQGITKGIAKELANSQDSQEIEEGAEKFIEWLRSGKLEIKACPTKRLHAKVYITTFAEDDRDEGRVITGSSNFSKAGLADNLEFNVELKNSSDYRFAKNRFKELWDPAVDVSEDYIQTINKKSWLNNDLTPYELYLKFLYEYFKDELNRSEDILNEYHPEEFMELEYQKQAVLNAKKILKGYGGVFIADVVGLGKTYISAMLANQLDGRNLVIAPPVLLNKDNPGSWRNVFVDFNVRGATFESIAPSKLQKLIDRGTEKYKNVFIDEAHRFRTETTTSYDKLARICRGKRVILVSATPLNNSPKDILSQLKLFQSARNSKIPGIADLEGFFNRLDKGIKKLDRGKNYQEYIDTVQESAKLIREKVLQYVMVRRTRTEIERYFKDDLKKQGLEFPKVNKPGAFFYQFTDQENGAFDKTQKIIASDFKYSKYMPMIFYKGNINHSEEISQKNMAKFMKILLFKRLESSFYAFKKTIDRFVDSYQKSIQLYDEGTVWVGKRKADRIFDLIENDDDEEIQRLIDEEKVERYEAKDFKKEYRQYLENDLNALEEIQSLWEPIIHDPKLDKLKEKLTTDKILKKNKLIIFTESKETAYYLEENLKKDYLKQVIAYSGSSGNSVREKVMENFDAGARYPKDNYRILISTEVLSEGINLHRSNIVINYDIPWNPTRLMQRAGRINRIDTKFKEISTFTFFPIKKTNVEIKLKEAAVAKIQSFIEMLGNDAKLLTEGEEIKSHDLFDRLTSKKTITGEDEEEESELKYLEVIRKVRDKNPNLFEKIKKLPPKARTARNYDKKSNALLTYFRKGALQKFYLSVSKKSEELDFITTAQAMAVKKDIKRAKINKKVFYEMLKSNKEQFEQVITEEVSESTNRRGQDKAIKILKIIKAVSKDMRRLTDEQEARLMTYAQRLEEGDVPKHSTKVTYQELNDIKGEINAEKVLAVIEKNISGEFLKAHFQGNAAETDGPRKVILSEYLKGK